MTTKFDIKENVWIMNGNKPQVKTIRSIKINLCSIITYTFSDCERTEKYLFKSLDALLYSFKTT